MQTIFFTQIDFCFRLKILFLKFNQKLDFLFVVVVVILIFILYFFSSQLTPRVNPQLVDDMLNEREKNKLLQEEMEATLHDIQNM